MTPNYKLIKLKKKKNSNVSIFLNCRIVKWCGVLKFAI